MKSLNPIVIAAAARLALASAALATNGYFAHGSGTTTDALGGAGVAEPRDAMAAEVPNIVGPDVIEDHITAGFSKQMSGRNQFHVALMDALSNTVTGPNPLEAPGQQTIGLKMDEWQLELG